jgi:hypothetical protein
MGVVRQIAKILSGRLTKMLISEMGGFGGVQELYRFDNDYGASVVSYRHCYGGGDGLWELAVIKWDNYTGLESHEGEWYLVYNTPITDDVIRWLTRPMVAELLKQIEALEPDDGGDDDRQPDEAQEWYDPEC